MSETRENEHTAPPDKDEGWPRSWIVVTAVLGIVAIIIVARMIGTSWDVEPTEPAPDDPSTPATPGPRHAEGPGAGQPLPTMAGSQVLLDVKDVQLPAKHSCIGTDGKAHLAELGKVPPPPCQLVSRGSHVRLEILRGDDKFELPVWLVAVLEHEAGIVFHAVLLPSTERQTPTWFASNLISDGRLAIFVHNPSGQHTLARVRFSVKKH